MKCVPVHHGIPAVLHRDEPWLHRHSENGALVKTSGYQIKLFSNQLQMRHHFLLTPLVEIHWRHYNVRMEIVIKTILWQIITHCAGTQDMINKLPSCCPCERKGGLETVAFLLFLCI